MASRAINIHVSGFTFPGMMDKSQRFWQFPTISITKKDSNKQIHTIFYVGLVQSVVSKDLVSKNMNKTKASKPNPNYNPNYSFANFAMKLNNLYFNHSPIPNAVAFYVTSTQLDGKELLFKDITFVKTGKNLGKRNATNVFTQAMSDVLSKYNKKNTESLNKVTNVVLPMLAEGEGISGNDDAIRRCIDKYVTANLVSGLFCQPKYDGIRVLMTLNPKHFANQVSLPYETDDAVICYSRKGKPLQISQHLIDELQFIMTELMNRQQLSTLVLDGEYYHHELPFQTINGFARGESESPIKDTVNIYVYDYCDGSDTTTYETRYNILNSNSSLFNYQESPLSVLDDEEDSERGHVLLSETKRFYSTDDILTYYKETLKSGYEGIMLRTPIGTYISSRTNNLIKIKPLLSYEYICVGYKFGKGKDLDIPVIECEVGEKGVSYAVEWWQLKKGFADISRNNYNTGKFYAKLKGLTEDEQRELGRQFMTVESNGKTRFENYYLGKKVTIEFLDFSRDMKPEKANCKGFVINK